MQSIVRRVRKKIEAFLLRSLLRPSARSDLRRYGTKYGGWVVPTSTLTESSTCYCAGVGEDTSFDMALIETFGCEVYAFDPTPRAIEYVARNADDASKFHFMGVGLWSQDRRLRFYAPKNAQHVSHSVVNLQGTTEFFEADCRRLSSLMSDLGHRYLDLLKLDIEGAEYEVLDSILDDGIPIGVICAEFDQPTSPLRIWRQVKRLEKAGYTLVNIDGWNYTFVQMEKTQ